MGINIGLLIWKEMKVKGMSREQLAGEVGISKHRVSTILKSTSIDTDILTRISIALDVNFFEHFRRDEDLAKIEIHSGTRNNQEIVDLKRLNSDKNKLLELYEETIKSQKKIITSLENLAKT